MDKLKIVSLAELQRKGELKFVWKEEGIPREGLLAIYKGVMVAYENRCKHLPVSLDYGDGKFFTPDREFFQCSTHGAIYKPDTGECIRGPCTGAKLRKLDVEELDGFIYLIMPSGTLG